MAGKTITVETVVEAPIGKVWEAFTEAGHITQWNHASDDWHSPKAENDLKAGGRFNYRMEARDGSMGFDFTGEFTQVEPEATLAYVMDDGRQSETTFKADGNATQVTTSFEAEQTHSEELQREGWQAILNNFKRYAEQL